MPYVAEFTMPPESLPFGETLVENPSTRIEVERIVPTGQSALPFFWVWGDSPQAFMEAAEREPNVEETELLATVGDGGLFRAEWSPHAELIRGIKRLRAAILESGGTAERWRFEVRAVERDRFIEFQQIFTDNGIPITLDRLFDLQDVVSEDHRPLTPEQRETLITAYREGYFESPREVSQTQLGERFDVSNRAISDRLRRGMRNLVGSTLIPSSQGGAMD